MSAPIARGTEIKESRSALILKNVNCKVYKVSYGERAGLVHPRYKAKYIMVVLGDTLDSEK